MYTTVSLSSEQAGDSRGIVQLRKGVMVDSSHGKRRLMPNEVVQLSFGALSQVLQQEGAIFYFHKITEKTLFLLAYPEYASWDL